MAENHVSAASGTFDSVKEHYRKKTLHETDGVDTNACHASCGADTPRRVKEVISECHEEVVKKCVQVCAYRDTRRGLHVKELLCVIHPIYSLATWTRECSSPACARAHDYLTYYT